ncbi:MAG: hypothetical protein ABJG42_24175 [Vibrio splendidus]
MSVTVRGTLAKSDPRDEYPIAKDLDISGGLKVVATKDDLAKLKASTLEKGAIAIAYDAEMIYWYDGTNWNELLSLHNHNRLVNLLGDIEPFKPNHEYGPADTFAANGKYWITENIYKADSFDEKASAVDELTIKSSLDVSQKYIEGITIGNFNEEDIPKVDIDENRLFREGELVSFFGMLFGVTRDVFLDKDTPGSAVVQISLAFLYKELSRILQFGTDNLLIRDRMINVERNGERVTLFKTYKKHHAYGFGNGEYDLILNSYSTPKVFSKTESKATISMPISSATDFKTIKLSSKEERDEASHVFTDEVIISSFDIAVSESGSSNITNLQAVAYLKDKTDPKNIKKQVILTSDYAYMHNPTPQATFARFDFDGTVITSINEEIFIEIVDRKGTDSVIVIQGKKDDKGVFKPCYNINSNNYVMNPIALRNDNIIGDLSNDFNIQTKGMILNDSLSEQELKYVSKSGSAGKILDFIKYEYDFQNEDITVHKVLTNALRVTSPLYYTIRVKHDEFIDSVSGVEYPTESKEVRFITLSRTLYVPKGSKVELTMRCDEEFLVMGTSGSENVFKTNFQIYGFGHSKVVVTDWHVDYQDKNSYIDASNVRSFTDNFSNQAGVDMGASHLLDNHFGKSVVADVKYELDGKEETTKTVIKKVGTYVEFVDIDKPRDLLTIQFTEPKRPHDISLLFASETNDPLSNASLSITAFTDNGEINIKHDGLTRSELFMTPHGYYGITFNLSAVHEKVTGFKIALDSGTIVAAKPGQCLVYGLAMGIKKPNLLRTS